MLAVYFLTFFLLIGLCGYFLFKKEKMDQKENMDLYEVFAGHPIKTPTLEIQKITWLPTFTVTFFDEADYEYAKSNGLFEKLNSRIKRRFYDTGFPVEQTVKYRWTI